MDFKSEIVKLQQSQQAESNQPKDDKTQATNTQPNMEAIQKAAQEMTLEEILAKLKGVVKDELLRQIIREIAKMKKAITKSVPHKDLDADYYPPKEFDLIYNLVKEGHYVLLFGDAGCGKSLLAKQIAKAMNKAFVPIPLGGGVRYKQLFGGDVILSDKSSAWKPSKFLESIQTPSVILLDEIFGVEPDVLAGLNGLLEPSTRCIQTPGGLFQLHPGCVIIATSNINGRSPSPKYTGQNKTDESLLDRFWVIHMDYDQQVEQKLGEQVPDGMVLVREVWELRMKCRTLSVEFNVSTRRLHLGLKAIAQGLFRKPDGKLDIDNLMKFLFYNNMSASERSRLGITI